MIEPLVQAPSVIVSRSEMLEPLVQAPSVTEKRQPTQCVPPWPDRSSESECREPLPSWRLGAAHR
jgi:hypothetical protein